MKKKCCMTISGINNIWKSQIFKVMRIVLFLITVSITQAFALDTYAQTTRLSLDFKNETIIKILDKVEDQSEFYFMFDQTVIDVNQRRSINCENKSVTNVLDKIFKDSGITYRIEDRQIALSSSEIIKLTQQQSITGNVADKNGQPLPGVTIVIKGTTQGSVTNADGYYSISNIHEGAILRFSFVGMLTQEIEVGSQTVINVTLKMDAIGLEEVVAIGYGVQSAKNLTSSVVKLSKKHIEDLPTNNIDQTLQGKISGVVIQIASGQPGAAADIRIRGGSSINRDNQPLYIIDGLPRSSEDFNPEDVASIEVLKDAAATAIYGARASNGVILVTTKKGDSGPVKFDFSYNTSFQSLINRQDYLTDGGDFLSIMRAAARRSNHPAAAMFLSGATSFGTGNPVGGVVSTRILEPGESLPEGFSVWVDPVSGEEIIYTSTDWQDLMYRSTKRDEYNFSVSGGNEMARYYIGSSYLDQDGIALGTAYKRFSLLSNLNFNVSEKFKIGTAINFTRSNTDLPKSANDIFGNGGRLAPTVRAYDDDGNINPGFARKSPLYLMDNNIINNRRNKISIAANADYEIIEGLVLSGNCQFFIEQEFTDTFEKSNFWDSRRKANAIFDENRTLQYEGLLKYNKTFADNHNFSALIGASRIEFDSYDLIASAFGGSTDDVITLNAAPEKTEASTIIQEDILISYFGRVNYNYKEKYLLSASLRRDGSARFGQDNLIGYFPGISAGWRLNEDFFPDSNVISDLKIRGSWGQTGNNNIPLYLAQGVYSPEFTYGGLSGTRSTELPNPLLQWETTTQLDLGVDIGILKDRIQLSVDIYRKNTENLLFSTPLPNTSGFSSVTSNIGEVRFEGVDVELFTSNLSASSSFVWTTEFNIGFNNNKVIRLSPNGNDKNRITDTRGYIFEDGTGIGGLAEGEPYDQMYGYKFLKVYATSQEAAEDGPIHDSRPNYFGNPDERTGGDVKWQDTDGNDTLNIKDQVRVGYAIPRVTGGFANNLSYKGFELYIFLDFALGHTIYNENRMVMNSQAQGNYNLTDDMLVSWNEEGDITDVPRLDWTDLTNSGNIYHDWVRKAGKGWLGASSQYLEKGDYLALRTVRLSYNLPRNIMAKLKIRSIKAYVSGQNLHYFTKYKGYNPETDLSDNGRDNGRYPLFRSISLGVKIGF